MLLGNRGQLVVWKKGGATQSLGGDPIGLFGSQNEPGSGLEPPYLVYKTKALPLS
jgi:hypothetical protein